MSAKPLQVIQFTILAALTLKRLVAWALLSYVLLQGFKRKNFFLLLIDGAFVIELGRQNMQFPVPRHRLHEGKLLRIGLASGTFAALFLSHSLDACSAKQVLTNLTLLRILVGEVQTHAAIILFDIVAFIFFQS